MADEQASKLMKQQYVFGLAAFLAIVGLSLFAYKWQVLDFPLTRN